MGATRKPIKMGPKRPVMTRKVIVSKDKSLIESQRRADLRFMRNFMSETSPKNLDASQRRELFSLVMNGPSLRYQVAALTMLLRANVVPELRQQLFELSRSHKSPRIRMMASRAWARLKV